MNCDTFQIYLSRSSEGVRLRVYADGDDPRLDVTVPCWATAFRIVVRSLARAMLNVSEPV